MRKLILTTIVALNLFAIPATASALDAEPEPEPGISVTPGSVDFGDVPENAELIAPKQITITSTGNVPIRVTTLVGSGEIDRFSVDTNSCEYDAAIRYHIVLDPQETCVLDVTLKQTPGVGRYAAGLGIFNTVTPGPIWVPLRANITGDTIPPDGSPNLSLSLKGPKTAKQGERAIVTATVKNGGTATSAAIVVKAAAPKSSRKVKAIRLQPMDPGKSVTRKFRVPVKRTAKGGFKVSVVLTSGGNSISRTTGRIKVTGLRP